MARSRQAHKKAAAIDPRQMSYDLIVGPAFIVIGKCIAILNKEQRDIHVTLTKIDKGFHLSAVYKNNPRKKLLVAAFEVEIRTNGVPAYGMGDRIGDPDMGANLDRDPTPDALLSVFHHWMRINFEAGILGRVYQIPQTP